MLEVQLAAYRKAETSWWDDGSCSHLRTSKSSRAPCSSVLVDSQAAVAVLTFRGSLKTEVMKRMLEKKFILMFSDLKRKMNVKKTLSHHGNIMTFSTPAPKSVRCLGLVGVGTSKRRLFTHETNL